MSDEAVSQASQASQASQVSQASQASQGAAVAAVAAKAGGPTGRSALEPWLRAILRCPKCKAELLDASGPSGPELHCTNPSCALAYRIDDGIPVLLVDEARTVTSRTATSRTATS